MDFNPQWAIEVLEQFPWTTCIYIALNGSEELLNRQTIFQFNYILQLAYTIYLQAWYHYEHFEPDTNYPSTADKSRSKVDI